MFPVYRWRLLMRYDITVHLISFQIRDYKEFVIIKIIPLRVATNLKITTEGSETDAFGTGIFSF